MGGPFVILRIKIFLMSGFHEQEIKMCTLPRTVRCLNYRDNSWRLPASYSLRNRLTTSSNVLCSAVRFTSNERLVGIAVSIMAGTEREKYRYMKLESQTKLINKTGRWVGGCYGFFFFFCLVVIRCCFLQQRSFLLFSHFS